MSDNMCRAALPCRRPDVDEDIKYVLRRGTRGNPGRKRSANARLLRIVGWTPVGPLIWFPTILTTNLPIVELRIQFSLKPASK